MIRLVAVSYLNLVKMEALVENFNTKESIQSELGSYESMYSMLLRRHSQGHSLAHMEKLTTFVVLGRYVSDEFGQLGRLNRELFTDDDRALMPPVMTREEFNDYCRKVVEPRKKAGARVQFLPPFEPSIGMEAPFILPPPHVVCAKCGRGWDIPTCHDIDSEGNFEDLDLTPFLGKKLKEVQEFLDKRADGVALFGCPAHIRNERTMPGNRKGRTVAWEYEIQGGDRGTIFFHPFHHGPCMRQLKQERSHGDALLITQEMRTFLEKTGFSGVTVNNVAVPEHFRRWLGSEITDHEELEEDIAEMAYFQIETKEGKFGLAVCAFTLLDLEGTGIALSDFAPGLAAQCPPEFQHFVPGVGPEHFTLLLYHLRKEREQV